MRADSANSSTVNDTKVGFVSLGLRTAARPRAGFRRRLSSSPLVANTRAGARGGPERS